MSGPDHAELTCDAEPALTRVEFEPVVLGTEETSQGRTRTRCGCKVRIREVDRLGAAQEPEFEALARSPRAVAEAIYNMALPHFRHGAVPWSDAMAALEAALAAVSRDGGR